MTTEERIEERIVSLQFEIQDRERLIEELQSFLTTEDAEPEPEEAPPHSVKAKPSRNGKPPAKPGKNAQRFAKLLDEHGPLRVGDLLPISGVSRPTLEKTLTGSPWFHRPGGRLSPWQLTEEGKAAVAVGFPGDEEN